MNEKEFERKVENWADGLEETITNKWNMRKFRIVHNSIALVTGGSLLVAGVVGTVYKSGIVSKSLIGLGVVGLAGTIITIKTNKK